MQNGCKTLIQFLTEAAQDLAAAQHNRFTREELAVRAWQKWPKTFGLRGFEDKYPNNNKTWASLYGVHGLIARGIIGQLDELFFLLEGYLPKTSKPKGKPREDRMRHAPDPTAAEIDERAVAMKTERNGNGDERLSLQDEIALRVILASGAAQKYDAGKRDQISFYDACDFWTLKPASMNPDQIRERLAFVRQFLRTLAVRLEDKPPVSMNCRMVSAGDMRVLANLHDYMEERFETRLEIAKKTKGRKAC